MFACEFNLTQNSQSKTYVPRAHRPSILGACRIQGEHMRRLLWRRPKTSIILFSNTKINTAAKNTIILCARARARARDFTGSLGKQVKKETPDARVQCRIVACLTAKIQTKITRMSTVDSGTMPSGCSDTSRESGWDIGGRLYLHAQPALRD